MAEEIAFENERISNFQGLMTLTLDWVILHTVAHHSSTSTYVPNFIEIEETFCGRTDQRTDERRYVRTYVRTDIWEPLIRSTQKSRPNNIKAYLSRQVLYTGRLYLVLALGRQTTT